MSRPNPSGAVIDRIRAVGEKAFVAFLDEVSDAGTQALSDTLPPVPGFRKNSQVGIKQRKRALFKEFAANRPTSRNRMKADQALYGFWRLWAIEHLGDPDGVKALIDAVEAAHKEEDTASKSAEVVLALFARLKQLSIEHKCSRESIARFFQFGPFDETPEIRALIDSAKSAGEIDRELAMEGLPHRLRQDEEEIKSLEGQLHILSTRIEASSDEAHAIRKELAAFQPEVSRLGSESNALRELLEEQAQSTDTRLTSQERQAQAFMKEAREQLAQLTSELGNLAGDIRRIETESSSVAAAVAARAAALEEAHTYAAPMPPALALTPPTGHFQPRRLSAGDEGKVAGLTSLEDAATCVASNLERIGLRKSAARPLAEEICAAAFAGQVVFFKGSLATAVARCAALSLSGLASVRVSMPLGLSSAESFNGIRDFIEPAIVFASALVIEGINRTALDIYTDAVADLVVADHSAEKPRGFDFIFATIMQGIAALAIEPRHLELGPVFDLDHLEWRVRRAATPLTPGSMAPDVLRDIRGRLESRSIDAEELLRLLRRFLPKKNPRIEGAAVAASASLHSIARRGPPTVLQSLAFGWIVPLWLALEVSGEDADAELDNGKCDSETADPRLASIFASQDFGQREPAR